MLVDVAIWEMAKYGPGVLEECAEIAGISQMIIGGVG